MANTTLWKKRVEAWRASGLTSTAFCADKGFTAGGLRHWAHRIKKMEGDSPTPPTEPVRLVRVVRVSSPPRAARRRPSSARPAAAPAAGAAREPALTLEVEGGRIGVAPGFDPKTLGAVLDVLSRRARLGRRAS